MRTTLSGLALIRGVGSVNFCLARNLLRKLGRLGFLATSSSLLLLHGVACGYHLAVEVVDIEAFLEDLGINFRQFVQHLAAMLSRGKARRKILDRFENLDL